MYFSWKCRYNRTWPYVISLLCSKSSEHRRPPDAYGFKQVSAKIVILLIIFDMYNDCRQYLHLARALGQWNIIDNGTCRGHLLTYASRSCRTMNPFPTAAHLFSDNFEHSSFN